MSVLLSGNSLPLHIPAKNLYFSALAPTTKSLLFCTFSVLVLLVSRNIYLSEAQVVLEASNYILHLPLGTSTSMFSDDLFVNSPQISALCAFLYQQRKAMRT